MLMVRCQGTEGEERGEIKPAKKKTMSCRLLILKSILFILGANSADKLVLLVVLVVVCWKMRGNEGHAICVKMCIYR